MVVNVSGLKTDTLTLKIIDQLILWMSSSSTDILERNLFEVIQLCKDYGKCITPDILDYIINFRS